MSDYIKCPWCGEDDFDLPGLKFHISLGICEAYETCERPQTIWERIAGDATPEPETEASHD